MKAQYEAQIATIQGEKTDLQQQLADTKKMTLIGSYSGNKSINVASYIKAGDTANNFILEIVGVPGASGYIAVHDLVSGGWVHYPYAASGGATASKSLSGNTLTITGMQWSVYVTGIGGTIDGNYPATQSVTYRVYHF
ncbi:MAG TPA: hypothetical protein PLV83_04760 [Bacilli bacterium]|nr:hypothetical protein [Bacilli bacterium]